MKDRKSVRCLREKKKVSSERWLLRQMNDPYVKQAQDSGYRSRSAFKLQEMLDKLDVIKPNLRILDLGCAPGGWCQILKTYTPRRLVGVDLLEVHPLEGLEFLQGDFCSPRVQDFLADQGPFDAILSDAAPLSTGHHMTDLLRISQMVEDVWDVAQPLLAPGGVFLAKAFHTQDIQKLCAFWRTCFEAVSYIKPQASRKESKEIYICAKGYSGTIRSEGLSPFCQESARVESTVPWE
jgi:23S rRNA (uridine2552-2'-O)-methyltransferase